jgi:hypothetical protein
MPVGRTSYKGSTKGPGPKSALAAGLAIASGATLAPRKKNQPSDFGVATKGKLPPNNMLGLPPEKEKKK